MSDDTITPPGAGADDVVAFKDVMNEALGKQFPDDESAIQAVKDTFSFVGAKQELNSVLANVKQKYGVDDAGAVKKVNEMIAGLTAQPKDAAQPPAPTPAGNYVTREDYERDLFYSQHPELDEASRKLISGLKASPEYKDKPYSDILASEALKPILDKVKAYDEGEKNKSVLQSNPRIGVATDKLATARTALAAGDEQAARANAVGAVMEAYEIK